MCYTDGWLERRTNNQYFASNKLYAYFGIDYEGWSLKEAFYTSYPLYRYFTPKGTTQTEGNKQGFAEKIGPEKDVFRRLGYDTARINAHRPYALLNHDLGPEFSDTNNQLNRDELKAVIELCRSKKIKFIFLSPPIYSLFTENTRAGLAERSRSFMTEVVDNEHVFYWDYHQFEETEPRNFQNVYHMSPYGGNQFTAVLNERLNKLEW